MKGKSITLAVCCLLIACKNNTAGSMAKVDNFSYPKIVDSLGVQNLYDKTRWHIYTLMCMDTPTRNDGTLILDQTKSFGGLELKFDSLTIKKDSIAFYFDYYLDQKAINLINYRDLKTTYPNGLLFYNGMDSLTICYVANHSGIDVECITPISKTVYDTSTFKMLKPLQPDVVAYINKNKKDLNPWFYKEAVKRGVIKE